ncbi:coiled-coil domain-containing protein 27 [Biomphalaria glabrata]|uniref:Uncharacterized protein n=1 Tax=Biomphalaria glabrata TaxID=6526 RepID=A0A2C9LJQ8_BIOGL|nr:coiled-coil domain-containing protein 27-like [Biomphalaria glabrata]
MSHSKLKNIRPLGSIRSKIQFVEKNTFSIPNWNRTEPDKIKGVLGSAITISTQLADSQKDIDKISEHHKYSEDSRSPQNNSTLSNSKENEISHEACKKEIQTFLKNERYLKEQLETLQLQNEEKETQIKKMEEHYEMLQKQLKDQEEYLKNELMNEKQFHLSTQMCLEDAKKEMQQIKESLVQKLEDQKEEMNKQIRTLELSLTEKDSIISDREQKLTKLKTQMADALKGNSWERQQQLEELTKELARIQKEYDTLQMKYKTLCRRQQSPEKSVPKI